jgi:hypothetical protein
VNEHNKHISRFHGIPCLQIGKTQSPVHLGCWSLRKLSRWQSFDSFIMFARIGHVKATGAGEAGEDCCSAAAPLVRAPMDGPVAAGAPVSVTYSKLGIAMMSEFVLLTDSKPIPTKSLTTLAQPILPLRETILPGLSSWRSSLLLRSPRRERAAFHAFESR